MRKVKLQDVTVCSVLLMVVFCMVCVPVWCAEADCSTLEPMGCECAPVTAGTACDFMTEEQGTLFEFVSAFVTGGGGQEVADEYLQKCTREDRLLMHLRSCFGVRFEDLQDTLYQGISERDFHKDVLSIVRGGVVLKGIGERICYVDRPSALPPPRCQGVASAMFHFLVSGRVGSFWMYLELSNQGYRDYSLSDFEVFEAALFYGGVDPSAKKANVYEHQVVEELQDFWQKHRYLSVDEFSRSVESKSAKQKTILWTLWGLQASKELGMLEQRVQGFGVNMKKCLSSRPRQARVMAAWAQHTGEFLSAPAIFALAGDVVRSKRGKPSLYNDILRWALDGWPIEYKKKEGKFALLPHKKEIKSPNGKSLMTLVYDLLCEYANKIYVEEIAYFAYSEGFWHATFSWHRGQLPKFYEALNEYKAFLVILKFLDEDVCFVKEQRGVHRQLQLWNVVQKDAVLLQASDYNSDASGSFCDDDVCLLRRLKKFLTSQEYQEFLSHVSARGHVYTYTPEERCIKNCLAKGMCGYKDLQSEFKSQGFDIKEGFWPTVRKLILKRSAGHMEYDPEEEKFFWHRGFGPDFKLKDCALEVFHLITDYPSIPHVVIVPVMNQKGYCLASPHELCVILGGFNILGITKYPEDFTKHRTLVNKKVGLKNAGERVLLDEFKGACRPPWWFVCVQRVLSWIEQEEMIIELWQAYLRHQRDCGQIEWCSAAKRRKTCEDEISAEEIIAQSMPELRHFLKSRDAWFLREVTPEV